jgi:hypothetical protein
MVQIHAQGNKKDLLFNEMQTFFNNPSDQPNHLADLVKAF